MSRNPEKEKTPAETGAFQNRHPKHTDNSARTQRQRILSALRKHPMTTLEIRRDLDVLGVAPRVKELRDRGYKIITYWQEQATECGNLHRVALYVLVREASV